MYLIDNGWDIGKKRICLLKKNIRIVIIPNYETSTIEIQFKLVQVEDIVKELTENAKVISDYLTKIKQKLPNAKITLDTSFSKERYMDIDASIIKKVLIENEYVEKKMHKNSFRKFKVTNSRNVTAKVDIIFDTFNETTNFLFKVDVENIIVELPNINREICDSAYYYFILYCRLHHSLVSEMDLLNLN